MGRKIEMKKIHDNIKCQVTFSKRRASLIKKAEEISMVCDVDVAFLAFSPAGRISKYCNRERILDFLDLYVNLPTDKRLSHVKNVQEKLGKLQALATIRTKDGMTKFLNDQIENLKLQLEKNQIEVQIAESNLRDFELNPAQEASLHQLSWCERNLQHCIEKVKEIKKEKILMENEGEIPSLSSQNGSKQIQMQFESWRNNEYKYPDNVFNEMLGKGKGIEVATSYGLHHQSAVPETQTWLPYASLPNNTYNAMHQPGNAMATNTYGPSQFQQHNQLWMEAPMPWQQVESNPSFGNFTGETSNFMENRLPASNYPSGFLESNSNNVTSTLADTFGEIPVVENQPNLVLDQMDTDNANGEDMDNVNEMIVSPPPSVEVPPSTSGVPSDLYDLQMSEVPSGDVSWNQKIEDSHMWDWDNLDI